MLSRAGKEFQDLGEHLIFCGDEIKQGHHCILCKTKSATAATGSGSVNFTQLTKKDPRLLEVCINLAYK